MKVIFQNTSAVFAKQVEMELKRTEVMPSALSSVYLPSSGKPAEAAGFSYFSISLKSGESISFTATGTSQRMIAFGIVKEAYRSADLMDKTYILNKSLIDLTTAVNYDNETAAVACECTVNYTATADTVIAVSYKNNSVQNFYMMKWQPKTA